MPRSKAQNEQIRAERRRQIVQAATPLFAHHGFSQTSISDVAAAAGLSHGSVFLHFASKEELFRAAVLEPLAEFEPLFDPARHPQGTPLERLRRMVDEQLAAVARREAYLVLVQYVIHQRDRFGELAGQIFAFSERICAAMVPLIQAAQEAGELVPGPPDRIFWSYFAYMNGLALTILECDPESEFWRGLCANAMRLFGPTAAGDG
ncbi:MAG TPA: TetR/AcrR family transcriptional regulator [Roseiflexaceae bacterium]|nr:TetR/AcrR family transcriptional regulator [Roseiflexaceae bacterium]